MAVGSLAERRDAHQHGAAQLTQNASLLRWFYA